uniref:Uncharacterized protein n=1 Tax=Ascaris lumbricoides TaxID=6252 RepID=A0A0M3HSS3_ASCLU
MAITASHITAVTTLLSVFWLIQPSRAFIIQCENCRCLPDYCSQNVPHSTCPCSTSSYQPVRCASSSATSANDLIAQWRLSQQQPQRQPQAAFSMQSPIVPTTSFSSFGQNGATSSSSLLSLHYSPMFSGQGQLQNTYTEQPVFATWGNLQSAASSQQHLQNLGNARLVLRVPISILANCQLRSNACPFGNPSIQAVDSCSSFPNTAGVRCITSEEIRRLFICAR